MVIVCLIFLLQRISFSLQKEEHFWKAKKEKLRKQLKDFWLKKEGKSWTDFWLYSIYRHTYVYIYIYIYLSPALRISSSHAAGSKSVTQLRLRLHSGKTGTLSNKESIHFDPLQVVGRLTAFCPPPPLTLESNVVLHITDCGITPCHRSTRCQIRGKKKHINRNKFAEWSRDWVGAKNLFMCFFRVIP